MKMLEMCFSTAPSVTTRRSAIGGVACGPRPSGTAPSRSRGAEACARVASRRRPSSWATTSGSRAVPPSPTRRIGVEELADVGDPVLEQVADAARRRRRAGRRRSAPRRTGTGPGSASPGRRARGPPARPAGPRRCGWAACRTSTIGQVGAVAASTARDQLGAVADLATTSIPAVGQAAGHDPRAAARVLGDHDPHGSSAGDHRRAAGWAVDGQVPSTPRHPVGQAAQAAAAWPGRPPPARRRSLDDEQVAGGG